KYSSAWTTRPWRPSRTHSSTPSSWPGMRTTASWCGLATRRHLQPRCRLCTTRDICTITGEAAPQVEPMHARGRLWLTERSPLHGCSHTPRHRRARQTRRPARPGSDNVLAARQPAPGWHTLPSRLACPPVGARTRAAWPPEAPAAAPVSACHALGHVIRDTENAYLEEVTSVQEQIVITTQRILFPGRDDNRGKGSAIRPDERTINHTHA